MRKKIPLYFHTLRYLKLSQLFWQCVRRLYRPAVATRVHAVQLNAILGEWKTPILRDDCFIENNAIIFLNETLPCDDRIWIDSQKKSKLWQYNLHYFNGILSSDDNIRSRMRDLLAAWLIHIKPFDAIAWDPYPISLRVTNLIKYQLSYGDLPKSILQSMYLQIRYLAKMPEYHLLGNHLLENARALIFAGLYFQGDEAKKWFALGMRILHREIPMQILSDGGYFELSPMYHALILELMLDLYHLFLAYQIAFPDTWFARMQKMRIWLQAMTHPDGDIAFFNDAALHVAPTYLQLENYAIRLGMLPLPEIKDDIIYFQDSGYVRVQKNKMVLLIDCAKVGPDYQPGHAHADTLSFELSIDGKRFIVNSGTNTYEIGQLRSWQRSTAAHNTVEINHCNSSDVWSAFRVAKRAYPNAVQMERNQDSWTVLCSHNGYRQFDVIHTRQWILAENEFIIEDACNKNCNAIAHFYLHPDINVEKNNKNVVLKLNEKQIMVTADSDIRVNQSEYYPEFGKTIPSHSITFDFSTKVITHFKITSGTDLSCAVD